MADSALRWLPPVSSVSLTAWPGAAPALAARLLAQCGLTLATAGHWTAAQDLVSVWLAPDHWQIESAAASDLAARLIAVAGAHGGVIDVTDARAVLRLTGPASRDVLARLLPLDLHPRAFAPHDAATTVAAHITVQLRQIDAAPTYDLACLRSYADSLWHAVTQAGGG